MTGPISEALAEEVRAFARRHGLVVWLDAAGDYRALADAMAADAADGEPPLVAYRGSFVEMLLEIEDQPGVDGVDPVPFIVYLPGYNQETVRKTPALELYRAGKRFERALPTLITDAAAGRVPPAEITAFLGGASHGGASLHGAAADVDADGRESVTLALADAWLTRHAIRVEGGLAARLEHLPPAMIVDALLDGGDLARELDAPGEGAARAAELWDHLHRRFGLDPAWRAQVPVAREATSAYALRVLLGWAQCVEFVHDLKRTPDDPALAPLRALPRATVEACAEVTTHMRSDAGAAEAARRRRATYVRVADEFQALTGPEIQSGPPDALGRFDTFREEETRLYGAALDALRDGDPSSAARWAADRLKPDAFWVQRDLARHHAWRLVEAAAALGVGLEATPSPLDGVANVEEAAERYAERGAAVDRAHRRLAQLRVQLRRADFPRAGALRATLEEVSARYRTWADTTARAFNGVCETHGFLPSAARRQRHVFERVVRPLAQGPGAAGGGPVAYFLVDALRFEMAAALADRLRAEADTRVDLSPWLCELPSDTKVGMNVLAPVVRDGRLRPHVTRRDGFKGFEAGEFRVHTRETRVRAIGNRLDAPKPPAFEIERLLDRPTRALEKELASAKIVVVVADEIDRVGEKDAGLRVFDSVLRDLFTAWQLLRDAGVKRFVFTSDHGFLLRDRGDDDEIAFGVRGSVADRRYALYPGAIDRADRLSVSLAALEYEGAEGHLVLPRGTAVFAQKKAHPTFVHGGNSPQERVIPVLTVTHRRPAGADPARHAVDAALRPPKAGLHRLAVRIDLAAGENATLAFGGAKPIPLDLRAPDAPDVTALVVEASGGARLVDGALEVAVGEPSEICFRLTGKVEQRVHVELAHPRGDDVVRGARPIERFLVEGPKAAPRKAPARAEPAEETRLATDEGPSWLAEIPHEGHRRVIAHLHAHGLVLESELPAMLGSPRAARRFSPALDALLPLLPFGVIVERTADGNRYLKV